MLSRRVHPGEKPGVRLLRIHPLNKRHGAVSFIYVFHTIFKMLLPARTAFKFSERKISEVSQKAQPDFILVLPAHLMLKFITELTIRLTLSHRKTLVVANLSLAENLCSLILNISISPYRPTPTALNRSAELGTSFRC